MDLDAFKASVMTLVIVALLIGAFALGLDAFQEDLGDELACEDSWVYNTTSRRCCGYSITANNCSGNETGMTIAGNASQEGLEGISNATSYLSTIGTLLGVAALVAVVIGAFYVIRR